MARNGVPYRWLDIADPEARRLMAAAQVDDTQLPVLVFEDGETLVRPSQSEIAARIGLRTEAELPFYDLVIVGAGPAGLAAAVYGASEGLRTLLVASDANLVQGAADDIRDVRGLLEADPDAPLFVEFARLERRLQEDAGSLLEAAEAYDEYKGLSLGVVRLRVLP